MYIDWRPLVAAINARHGTQLTLGARYGRGEQGAYTLTDGANAHYMLKRGAGGAAMARFLAAAVTTARLQRDGYPTPRYRYIGEIANTAYAVLDALPGEPLMAPSAALIPQLFALNSLQVGRAGDGARDWPHVLLTTILSGGEGYCELATLQSYSEETAVLLACCQDAARAARGVPCIMGDIVHYDFNPANLLLSAARITGVVDWDGTCAGDCAFDLATLLFYAYDSAPIRKAFGLHLRQRLDPRIAALYFAHLIVRQVDWVIRHDDTAAVDYWLAIARTVREDFLLAV